MSTEPSRVPATQRRAMLRGEWLQLRVEGLIERTRANPDDPAPRLSRLREIDDEMARVSYEHLDAITQVFHLDDAEALLLECLAAVELPGAACAALLDLGNRLAGANREVIVDALVAAIADRDLSVAAQHFVRLSPGGRLRREALVEVDDQDRPRRLSRIRLGAGMLDFLLDELPAVRGCTWLTGEEAHPHEVDPRALAVASAALLHPGQPLLVIVGPSGTGRGALARVAARSLSRPVLHVEADALVASSDAESTIARLGRDARLVDAVVFAEGLTAVDAAGGAPSSSAGRRSALRALSQIKAPMVITSDGDDVALSGIERPIVRILTALPDEPTRARLWSSSLPPHGAGEVARMFALSPRVIRHAGVGARVLAAARTGDLSSLATVADARTAIHSVVAASGVRALGAESDFRPLIEELVLSPDNAELLIELVMRVRMRHRVMDQWGFRSVAGPAVGVAALFHGPPGTGKSMAAHAVATCLGVECFRIDLSQVVSKWVGETEKSLAKVFEMAERSDALLLFDEADSLFTKRTEVKSSNDRYANLEVNYLLQRIEAFPGLAILTTNHVAAIDGAFMRRLAVQIRFDFPDVNEREELWRRKFPPSAPLGKDVSLALVAERYPMTGARIRNAALRAAFLAADGDQGITQEHLERAIHAEYRGAGLTPGKTVMLE